MVKMNDPVGAGFVVACFILAILILLFGDYIIPNWDRLFG